MIDLDSYPNVQDNGKVVTVKHGRHPILLQFSREIWDIDITKDDKSEIVAVEVRNKAEDDTNE